MYKYMNIYPLFVFVSWSFNLGFPRSFSPKRGVFLLGFFLENAGSTPKFFFVHAAHQLYILLFYHCTLTLPPFYLVHKCTFFVVTRTNCHYTKELFRACVLDIVHCGKASNACKGALSVRYSYMYTKCRTNVPSTAQRTSFVPDQH